MGEQGEQVPAVVAAGDRRAAKAVHGESKPYLEAGGCTLVEHIVAVLQSVPEVSEVWVVGDAPRLDALLGQPELRAALRKPLTILPQFRNLYENLWESYRRLLPGAPPEGRDPGPGDAEQRVLYLSADLPFATPEEVSAFVRLSFERGCDYALGLVEEEAMEAFYPVQAKEGEAAKAGVRMAYFNVREGRMRQSNLHLVKPAKIGHRHYIEEMYEHRYQKQIGPIIALAWRLLTGAGGGFSALWAFGLLQLTGWLDRRGLHRLADRLRQRIPLVRAERIVSRLLSTDFAYVTTGAGGCAVDVDNDEDYEASLERFDEWSAAQERRARELYGSLVLAERASPEPSVRVAKGGDA